MMDKLKSFERDAYIARIIRDRIPCTVILVNGYQMHSVTILAQSGDALLLRTQAAVEEMVYEHAISTIRPPHPLVLTDL